jgi:hypothetical protein
MTAITAAPPHPRANPLVGSALDRALLLQRFRIRSEQERVPLDTAGITLRPRGAVPIRVESRYRVPSHD